jgi:hypothetical protein
MELVNDYDAGYLKYAAVGLPKVQDFCIVANRDKIYPSDQKMWDGNKVKKLKSGNRTYRSLIDEHTRCYTVRTHMPLLRKEYHTYNDWQITYDFVTEYHKVEAASNWWLNQQQNMAKNNQADLRYN